MASEASTQVPCDVDAAAGAQTCSGATPSCCAGFCTNTATDPKNCGQCGVSCTAHEFCTGVQCDKAVVANVCGNPKATVILDQYDPDNEAGAMIGAALAANCSPPTVVVQSNADAGGVSDPSTQQPTTGVGNTCVFGGGSFGQTGVAYLETKNLAPLYVSVSGNDYYLVERATGNKLVTTTLDAPTAHHDYFYIQMVVDPQNGTLSFCGVGMEAAGTAAAGFYASTEIVPNRANYPGTWYVFDWTDTNGDSTPNAGDTFTQLASGM